ncbi:MAG TPA: hypothetical protein VGC51_02725 [Hansschlegelia sp.]
MSASADLVVVSSPLQCMNAVEHRARTGGIADVVLIGDRAGGGAAALEVLKRRPDLWRRILSHPRRPQPSRLLPLFARDLLDAGHRASLERLASTLGPRRTLVFGDYRNVSQRVMVERVPHDELVLVDDGSVAPQVAAARAGRPQAADPARFQPGWFRTGLGRSALGERPPAAPPALTFFTIYGTLMEGLLAPSDRVVPHAYEAWRTGEREIARGDAVWTLGSNHVEAGICSEEAYRSLVLGGVAALRGEGRSGPFLYRPHRGENAARAARLAAEAGMTLAPAGPPVELACLDADPRPSVAMVIASTAADTLSVLDPGLEIVRLAPPEGYLRRQRDHILAVMEGHDALNQRLRVIRPQASSPA